MKKIFFYFRKCSFYYGILVVISVFLTGAIILASTVLGDFTDQIIRLSNTEIGKLLILVVVAFLFQELLDVFYMLIQNKIQVYVYASVQKKLLHQVVHLPFEHPKLKNSSDLYTIISRYSEDFTKFLSETVPNILYQTIRMVLSLLFITVISWRITVIYLVATLISLLLQFFISKIMKKASYCVKKTEADLNIKMKDVLSNHTLIKVWGCFDWIEDSLKNQEDFYIKANLRMNLRTMPMSIIGILGGIFPILSLCLAGMYLIPNGLIPVSSFMIIFYLCQTIMPDQLHYADLWTAAMKAKPSRDQLFSFLEEKTEKDNSENKNRSELEEIVIDQVCYQYPKGENWAVENISMKIGVSKKVAFVGASGSGKSTLMKLMAGLITPQKGNIRGTKGIYGDQFPFLFTDTLQQNILYSHEQKDETFTMACQNAQLDEFVSGLEQGYQTMITENGEQFSGGQRQRIALARSLNSRQEVLLLDEVFSALDPKMIQKIMKQLMISYPKTTMVFGLHQKELLSFMDEIYVFDHGHILEHGTYEELCEKSSILEGIIK